MTQSTRRPGFRLPWTGEGEDAPQDRKESATQMTDAAQAAADAPAPGETVVGVIDPSPNDEPQPPVGASSDEEAAAPVDADAAAPDEASDFLRSLVGAMRGVADEERSTSVTELRQAVDERVAELERRATERAEELRRKTELDVNEVGDWAKGEIERINGEASRKVDARRQLLNQQLADHETRSTGEVESVRERVAGYERELDAFFTQLGEINDPASFVAAARRMPKPPSLEGGKGTPHGNATATPTASLDARLAQLGINRNSGAAAIAETAATAETSATAETAAEPASEEAAASAEAAAAVASEPKAAVAAEPDEPVASVEETPGPGARDAQLAQRLAELDARPEPSTATTVAPGGDDVDEVATAIMVKGLGSFGAITSFKQRLERLATVRTVTLSLGPTGEFVYRATHPREIDLGAAITTLEPGSTVDRQADGSLRVTVQSR